MGADNVRWMNGITYYTQWKNKHWTTNVTFTTKLN